MDYIDCVVVGAGVIGLAIGKKISEEGLSCLILDSMPKFGSVTSSRNSEVIHAGIYYPEDSLKSSLCVRGKKLLYEYCEKKSVPYKPCGKLIVATSAEELESLEMIKMKASANSVDDLSHISGAKIKEIEPNVSVLEGLFSPSTGIIVPVMKLALSDDKKATTAEISSIVPNLLIATFLLNIEITAFLFFFSFLSHTDFSNNIFPGATPLILIPSFANSLLDSFM